MSSVDNRIVKMVFDNEKFEAGVAKTLETLDKLKEKLTFKDTDKAFKSLEDSANGMKFNGVEAGIESLNKRFSTLGIVGMEVTRRITNAAIDAGKKLAGATFGQAKSGGMSRSLNIEQARFQLEGLLKDGNKVEEIFNAAKDAVDGTAYGLDEAAKAASVLAASGITDGDRLNGVLKSIAGSAAMTGRGFSDISDIYSTVASNGKLMTMQLRQFAASGLNVSAILAKEYKTSEETINEWVRKGKISFDDFSQAMMQFSDQAGKANETYSGAMSNMKSALNRIGQIFTDPYVDNMKYVFNAARLGLNEVQKAIKTFEEPINKAYESVRKFITDGLGALTGKGGKDKNGNDYYIFGSIGKSVFALIDIFKYLVASVKPIKTAFKDMFPSATIDNLKKAIDRFKEFTSKLQVNERQAKNLEYVYKAIFSIFKLIGTVVSTVIKGIARVFEPFGGLLNVLNFILGVIGRLVYAFVTVITKVRLVSRIFTAVTYVINWVFTAIVALVKGIAAVIRAIAKSKPVVAIVNAISTAFKFCVKYITLFIGKTKEAAKKLASFIGNATMKAISKFVSLLASGLKSIVTHISNLIPKFKQYFELIKDSKAMKAFVKSIDNAKHYLSIFVDKLKETGKAIVDWVNDHQLVQKFFSALSTGLQIVIGVIVIVAEKIKTFAKAAYDFFKETGLIDTFVDLFHKGFEKLKEVLIKVTDKIKEISEIISGKFKKSMGAAADAVQEAGGKIDGSLVFQGIKAFFKKVIDELVNTTKYIKEFSKGFKNFFETYVVGTLDKASDKIKEKASHLFDGMNIKDFFEILPKASYSVFLLNLALFVRQVKKATRNFGGAAKEIRDFFHHLTHPFESVTPSKWAQRAKMLLTFAAAIFILAKAVQTLGEMEPTKLAIGLGAVAISMIGMSVALALLAKSLNTSADSVNAAQVGLGLLLIAASMLVLAKAVKTFAAMDVNAMWLGMVRVGAALLLLTIAVKAGLGSAQHMASTGAGLLLIAGALLALSLVLKIYSKFKWETYNEGMKKIFLGLVLLVGAVRFMGQPTGVLKAALAINLMVVALLGLAVVIKMMAFLKPEEIIKGLAFIAGSLLAITLAIYALQATNPKDSAAAIVMVAAALAIVALSIKALEGIDYETLKTGFIGLAAVLVLMTAALYILAGNNGIMQAAGCLVAVAAGLALLSLAIGQMASMPLEGLQTSLVGLTVLLAVMAYSLYQLAQLPDMDLIKAAGAMLIMAAAMGVLTLSISALAKIPFNKLIAGVVAMAAALLVMVIAGDAATGCVPGLLALSAAFIAFGIAANLVAKGIAIVIEAFSNGASKIAPLVEAIGDSIAKVVDAISGGISKVLDSIAGIFDSMGNAAKHAGEGVKLIADGIAKLTHLKLGDMVATLGKVADALGDFSKQGKEMASIGEGVGRMADGLKSVAIFGNLTASAFVILSAAFNVLRPAIDGIPQALTITSAAFSSFSSSLLTFGIGIGAAISSVVVEFQKLGASVGQLSSSMLALTGVGTIVSTVMSIVTTTTNLAKASVDRLKASAASVGKSLAVIGLNASVASVGLTGMAVAGAAAMNRFKSSITSGGNQVRSAMASAMASMIASTRATLSNLGKVGSSAMSSLASGIQSGASKVKTAGKTAGNSAKTGFESVKFESAGTAACQGFLNGLNNSSYAQKITARGTALGNMAYNAAKKALESKSPSKKFRQLGIWANQGFIIGLGMLQNKVYDSSYAIGENAADALTESVSQIHDMLDADLDANPTITPVLDLSNVQNGINTMNGMIDTRTMSARLSTNMSGVGMVPALAGSAGDTVTNNNTNTFNITVDGTESPEAFADRLVEAIHMRQRMS